MLGKYAAKDRNTEGHIIVDFSMERRGREEGAQMDYIIYTRCNLKERGDCKLAAGENVASQLRVKAVVEVDCWTEFRKTLRQALGGKEKLPDDWQHCSAKGN